MAVFLKPEEVELVYQYAEKITGASQQKATRNDLILRNVEKRINEIHLNGLEPYLNLTKSDPNEYKRFISDLTIHTTSWFRENEHFQIVCDEAKNFSKNSPEKKFKIWSTACSTGEEVYSLALSLEKLCEDLNLKLNYSIHGSDIDSLSVDFAKRAIYNQDQVGSIDLSYKKYLLFGENRLKGLFTLDSVLRAKTQFFEQSLAASIFSPPEKKYHVIFCRNVLIYFSKEDQNKIVKKLIKHLDPGGLLVLGHCDSTPHFAELTSEGHSSFRLTAQIHKPLAVAKTPEQNKILIIDDSKTIRTKIKKIFADKISNSILLEANSASEASTLLLSHKISLITLDLNMEGENGASWLKHQRALKMNVPTIIVSDLNPQEANHIFGALINGAEAYIVKSQLHQDPDSLVHLAEALIEKNRVTTEDVFKIREFKQMQHKPEFIVAGASTGGPEALVNLFSNLPKNFPPLIIVQHISSEFTQIMLERLCQASGLLPGSLEDNIPLEKGKIYFSIGDYHLKLKYSNFQLYIEKSKDKKVEGFRPSVDVLFSSAASVPRDCLGVLLTGMGKDGAAGLLKMAETNKCFTLVQDKASSIVFGMPEKAIKLGAACFVGNIAEIRKEIFKKIGSES